MICIYSGQRRLNHEQSCVKQFKHKEKKEGKISEWARKGVQNNSNMNEVREENKVKAKQIESNIKYNLVQVQVKVVPNK